MSGGRLSLLETPNGRFTPRRTSNKIISYRIRACARRGAPTIPRMHFSPASGRKNRRRQHQSNRRLLRRKSCNGSVCQRPSSNRSLLKVRWEPLADRGSAQEEGLWQEIAKSAERILYIFSCQDLQTASSARSLSRTSCARRLARTSMKDQRKICGRV